MSDGLHLNPQPRAGQLNSIEENKAKQPLTAEDKRASDVALEVIATNAQTPIPQLAGIKGSPQTNIPTESSAIQEQPLDSELRKAKEQERILENLIKEKTDEMVRSDLNGRVRVLTDRNQGITVVVGRLLGSGSFGDVHLARDPEQTEDEIVKVAKRQDDKSLAREYRILQAVNPDRAPGLQLPPRKFVDLSENQGSSSPGYLAPRYSGSMEMTKLQSSETIQQALFQLTNGLIVLHSRNTYHGDIKPHNMLQMPGRYDLADLGGAQQISNIENTLEDLANAPKGTSKLSFKEKIFGTFTRFFITDVDLKILTLIMEKFSRQCVENPSQKEALIKKATSDIFLLMRSRDVYALSVSFIWLTHLVDRFQSTHGIPLEKYSFYLTESHEKSEAIFKCLRRMRARLERPTLLNFRKICNERLAALHELHSLMQAVSPSIQAESALS